MNETKLTSEISYPTDFCLVQLVQHKSDDEEVMSSNSAGGNFLMKFILFYITLDLSDSLKEMRQISLSRKPRLFQIL